MATEAMKACREKYWSEIDDKKKIERMREEVKRFQRWMEELNASVCLLKKHQHNVNGNIVVELRATGEIISESGFVGGKSDDEVYF